MVSSCAEVVAENSVAAPITAANVPFYKELANQGIRQNIPVVAFSVGEEELAGLDAAPLVGHLAAWNYFQSVDTPENAAFIAAWKAFTKNDKV